jgi:hypothetical protein
MIHPWSAATKISFLDWRSGVFIAASPVAGSMTVRGALAKLNNRDVRQRRRAVRHLFEMDDAEALQGFVGLLEDSDPWFREKAMDAVKRWAASKDLALFERLASSGERQKRLLAASISGRAGRAGEAILAGLCADSDEAIRLAAWEARLLAAEAPDRLIEEALDSHDRAIRRAAAHRFSLSSGFDSGLLSRILQDENVGVRQIGIRILETHPEVAESGDYDSRLAKLADMASAEAKARIAAVLIGRATSKTLPTATLLDWVGDEDPRFITPFARTLRGIDWWDISGMPDALTSDSSDNLAARLLRGARHESTTTIRESLLTDSTRSPELRSRLIEDMIGRPVSESSRTIIESLVENPDQQIAASAANLLAELD